MLPSVTLYGLIGGFSGVTPHNHVDRIASSDQRIDTFANVAMICLVVDFSLPNRSSGLDRRGSGKAETELERDRTEADRCSDLVALVRLTIPPISVIPRRFVQAPMPPQVEYQAHAARQGMPRRRDSLAHALAFMLRRCSAFGASADPRCAI